MPFCFQRSRLEVTDVHVSVAQTGFLIYKSYTNLMKFRLCIVWMRADSSRVNGSEPIVKHGVLIRHPKTYQDTSFSYELYIAGTSIEKKLAGS